MLWLDKETTSFWLFCKSLHDLIPMASNIIQATGLPLNHNLILDNNIPTILLKSIAHTFSGKA